MKLKTNAVLHWQYVPFFSSSLIGTLVLLLFFVLLATRQPSLLKKPEVLVQEKGNLVVNGNFEESIETKELIVNGSFEQGESTTGPELLLNCSFEQDLDNWKRGAVNWAVYNGALIDGSKFLEVNQPCSTCTDDDNLTETDYSFYQDIPISNKPAGTVYTLTLYVQANIAAGIEAGFWELGGNKLEEFHRQTFNNIGTPFQKLVVTGALTQGDRTNLRVQVYLKNDGVQYDFDAFSFSEGSGATVTGWTFEGGGQKETVSDAVEGSKAIHLVSNGIYGRVIQYVDLTNGAFYQFSASIKGDKAVCKKIGDYDNCNVTAKTDEWCLGGKKGNLFLSGVQLNDQDYSTYTKRKFFFQAGSCDTDQEHKLAIYFDVRKGELWADKVSLKEITIPGWQFAGTDIFQLIKEEDNQNKALYLKSDDDYSQAYQEISIEDNTNYNFSLEMKGSTTDKAFAGIEEWCSGNIDKSENYNLATKDSTAYETKKGSFLSGTCNGEHKLRVSLKVDNDWGAGELWVDNVNLEAIESKTTALNLKISFDGVPANNIDSNLFETAKEQEALVSIVSSDGTVISSETVNFAYKSGTQWDAVQSINLSSGKYVIKIKGPIHRQILFCRNQQATGGECSIGETLTINTNQDNDFDFSGYPLEFGDIDQNGSVSVNDYSAVKACRDVNAVAGDDNYDNQGCKWADGNFDGVVDNTDIDLLYKTLSTKSDDQ